MMSRISDIGRLLYVDPNRRAEFIKSMQEQGVVKFRVANLPQGRLHHLDFRKRARGPRPAKGNIYTL